MFEIAYLFIQYLGDNVCTCNINATIFSLIHYPNISQITLIIYFD